MISSYVISNLMIFDFHSMVLLCPLKSGIVKCRVKRLEHNVRRITGATTRHVNMWARCEFVGSRDARVKIHFCASC